MLYSIMHYRFNIFKFVTILSFFKYGMYIFFLLVFTCWIKWLFRNFNFWEKIIFWGDFKIYIDILVNKVIFIFLYAASKAAKMAILIFFYYEIHLFHEGVFSKKICGPGGYYIAPCPINRVRWAESNDTTLNFLAPPEDLNPTLPVFDPKTDVSGWLGLLNIEQL
jgi:hypothetical protein